MPPWEQWPGASLRIEGVWIDDRARWESIDRKWYFDPQAADDVAAFGHRFLRLTKGESADRPFTLLPWQDDLVVRPAFGWRCVSTGLRRFRTVVIFVPKKNGKSALCSLIAIDLMAADGEPGAEVYSAALNEKQARIVFDEASEMVDRSPALRAAAGVKRWANAITRAETASSYRVLCGKPAANHGYNVHGLVLDELHTQRNRELLSALKRGTSNRRQPLVFEISTAGTNRTSIAYEEYEYAKGVLAGTIEDPRVLPVIFEMKKDDDWTSPEVWARVNPGLGVTKQLSYMIDACREAQNEPRKRNEFLNLDLNKWTESRSIWIEPEAWAACKRDVEEPADWPTLLCCLGFDLSETRDLTCMVAAFRRPDTPPAAAKTPAAPQAVEVEVQKKDERHGVERRVVSVDFSVDLRAWFWMPEAVIEERIREKKDDTPWQQWVEQGWLRVTPGPIVDYRHVRNAVIDEVMPKYRTGQAGYDKWGGARQLMLVLREDGLDAVEVRQGILTLSAPSKLFEALVFARRITHDGNPILAWCVGNAQIATDRAGNIMPEKPGGDARSMRRIDGVSATVTALERLMVAPAPTPRGSSRIRVLD